MLQGDTFLKQYFSVNTFAAFIDTFLGGESGIKNNYMNSFAMTYEGNEITIKSGLACIRGRFLREDSESKIKYETIPTRYCRLVIEIDLSKENEDTVLKQAYYKILVSGTSYPELRQDNIVENTKGIYQYELAQFSITQNQIQDFVDKRSYLDFDSIYEEVNKTVGDYIANYDNKKADKTTVDNIQSQVNALASGSPKGVYASTSDLKSANPVTGVYIVSANGHIYSWTKNQSGDPIDLGVYQAIELENNSVNFSKLTDEVNSRISHYKLLSKEEKEIGFGYILNNGNFNSASQRITNYFWLSAGSKLILTNTSKQFRLARFDQNKNFISVTNYNTSIYINSDGFYRLGDINGQITQTVDEFHNLIEVYNAENIYDSIIDKIKPKKYVVDKNGSGNYTSLMNCFNALKDDENEKIIYIKEGTYDIFDEIGGTAFCNTIPSNATDWKTYSTMVPNNTKLIGLGNVILNFLPEDNEITEVAARLLSPINVRGNVDIENIKVFAKNCRYCIHDETSADIKYRNSTKIYKNVKAVKFSSKKGYQQAYASGYDTGMNFLFENCEFDCQHAGAALSMHNTYGYGSNNIIIKDCILKSSGNTALAFYNSADSQLYNNVKISNSYLEKYLTLSINGDLSRTDIVNAFEIKVNNCNNFTLYKNSNLQDNLEHEFLNVIGN